MPNRPRTRSLSIAEAEALRATRDLTEPHSLACLHANPHADIAGYRCICESLEPCDACEGRGYTERLVLSDHVTRPCDNCHGAGLVPAIRNVRPEVPEPCEYCGDTGQVSALAQPVDGSAPPYTVYASCGMCDAGQEEDDGDL